MRQRPVSYTHLDVYKRQELGDTWKNARKIKLKNSSLFKIDVLVYPQLAFKNLVITQIYQVLFDLSPAIEISLWKGCLLYTADDLPMLNLPKLGRAPEHYEAIEKAVKELERQGVAVRIECSTSL